MTVKRTRHRTSLKQFLASDEDMGLSDVRSNDLARQIVVDPAVLEALREIFAGTEVIEDQVKIKRILDVRAEIQRNWSDARDAFLNIGRALLSLESTLSKSEFQRLRAGNDRLFPFSDATATQFRQIARAVDSGRIPYEACPGSYGTAYQITLLDDDQLTLARNRGLLRSDVTRREISLLRNETKGSVFSTGRLDKSQLQDERRRLNKREQQLLSELDTLRRRVGELERLLGPSNSE